MNETIKIFISSRQNELENERTWAKEAVEETGRDLGKCFLPILVEEKPTPPSTTTNTQCHEDLKESKAVICVYYKTISEIVKNEFRWANERGIPIFIFKKKLAGKNEADDELKSFIENEARPPSGEPEERYGIYVYRHFQGKDIKNEIKASLKKYYPTWFNFKCIREEYLPSKAWPGKLEIIREVYVKPRCYSMAEEILKSKRLLIITGPAHIGKTSMGFHLADSLPKALSRRFPIFPRSGDLSELADLHDSAILFDDPFGGARYEASPIADRFDRLQGLACKNYIILTSRREVLNEALKSTKLGEKNLKDITIEMRQEDYSDEDFGVILTKHLQYFKADQGMIALANSHKGEIIKELRFPHNYEVLVREELGKVIKGEKNFWQALKDAREIERVVGNWFEGWYSKDKEVFYFLLTLALCDPLGEEDFLRIHGKAIQRLNKERQLGLPLPGNLAQLRRATASYVSQSSSTSQGAFQYGAFQEDAFQVSVPLRLEHQSYREGIMDRIIIDDVYMDDTIIILKEMAVDEAPSVRISAAVALGEAGKKRLWEALLLLEGLIRDKNLDVAFYSAEALGLVGKEYPRDTVLFIDRLLGGEDLKVKICIVKSLEIMAMSHPREIASLLERLAKDKESTIRHSIAQILRKVGRINPKVIVPILETLASDEDPSVQMWFKVVLEGLREC